LFLNQCLYDYAHLNLANDNHLDQMEAGAVSGDQGEMAEKISIASSNILSLQKVVSSLHIILMSLVTKRNRFISDEARDSFESMLHNVLAIRASIDSSRDLLGGFVGELQARAANRLSKIAGLLTIVSVIFLPLSLVAGIYGMNTEMPDLKRMLAFSLVAVILAILMVILTMTVRRLWRISGRGKSHGYTKSLT
jgi:magnesium transporter